MIDLGEAWALLGLWRFHLLLPASPVDPTLKYKLRHEQLSERAVHLAEKVVPSGRIRLFLVCSRAVMFTPLDSLSEVTRSGCDHFSVMLTVLVPEQHCSSQAASPEFYLLCEV
jgi:hypothetical protein